MRASGILMPIFSLPGSYGIGTLGREAYRFADFLAKAKQTYWQILPIGPTGYGDSPYQSFSAFAGNPYFIDLELLVQDGLLKQEELPASSPLSGIDYSALFAERLPLLNKATDRLAAAPSRAFRLFCEEQEEWLEDYALFMAIKEEQGQKGLADWDEGLRTRKPAPLAAAAERLSDRVFYFKAMQFLFYKQWSALKKYANKLGIRIIGDIPIYVSADSSDLWCHPELFQTDTDGRLIRVAGCPPDAFAADGQLWGNPLYDWTVHELTGFGWWKQRMLHATKIYDVVRIDHFRGFESYFSIPAGDTTARNGVWCKGPDKSFIRAMHEALPGSPIIAEDLGYLTPEVKSMLKASGYPGMKLLQFAFDTREAGNYLPYSYPKNSVAYTGTHDNTTAEGWKLNAAPEDVALACKYLCCTTDNLTDAMICAVLGCNSDTAILPMADWLHLGDEARLNTPSTQNGNWQWRMDSSCLTDTLAAQIADLTELYGRTGVAE